MSSPKDVKIVSCELPSVSPLSTRFRACTSLRVKTDIVLSAQPKTDEQKATITSRLLKREEAKRAKLVALGIDYEFSGYAEKVIAPSAPAVAATEKADKSPKAIKGKKEKKEKKEKSSEVSRLYFPRSYPVLDVRRRDC